MGSSKLGLSGFQVEVLRCRGSELKGLSICVYIYIYIHIYIYIIYTYIYIYIIYTYIYIYIYRCSICFSVCFSCSEGSGIVGDGKWAPGLDMSGI